MKAEITFQNGEKVVHDIEKADSMHKFIELLSNSSLNNMFAIGNLWYNRLCIHCIKEKIDENKSTENLSGSSEKKEAETKSAALPFQFGKKPESTPKRRGK